MYCAFRESIPGTSIDLAVRCRFVPVDENGRETQALNLITCQANLLTVYRIEQVLQPNSDQVQKTRFISLLQTRLQGCIASLASVKNSVAGRGDLLLLGFRDAKMSIVEFNADLNELQTVSMHYYEQDRFRDAFAQEEGAQVTPRLRIDPTESCAVMKVYDSWFAVLPFRRNDLVLQDDQDDELKAMDKPPYRPSFTVQASQFDPRIRNIVDFAFLYGFYEPTMAILFEPTPTVTARLAAKRDTMALAIVSMDLAQQQYALLYYNEGLPYDCHTLTPLPKPMGGVLVTAVNSILHFDQGIRGSGVAVNAFPARSTAFPLMDQSKLCLHLDGSQVMVVGPTDVLITCRDGEWWRLSLKKEGRSISKYTFDRIGRNLLKTSVMVQLSSRHLFLGSDVADSLLIEYELVNNSGDNKNNKKIRLSSGEAAANDVEIDELDMLLGSAPAPEQTEQVELPQNQEAQDNQLSAFTKVSGGFRYRILDRLLCAAPVRDMAIGESCHFSKELTHPPLKDHKAFDVVTCVGEKASSALCVFQRSLRPVIRSTFTLEDKPLGIWTIFCDEETLDTDQVEPTEIVPRGSSIGEYGDAATPDVTPERTQHKFILIAKQYNTLPPKVTSPFYTIILQAGEELGEITGDFFTAGLTVGAGSMFYNTRCIQVYSTGVKVLDSHAKMRQELKLEGEWIQNSAGPGLSLEKAKDGKQRWIRDCVIEDLYVVLILNDDTILALKGDLGKKELVFVDLPSGLQGASVVACSLFTDISGLFLTIAEQRAVAQKESHDTNVMLSPSAEKPSTLKRKLPDDDDDIYGEDNSTQEMDPLSKESEIAPIFSQISPVDSDPGQKIWCVLYRDNGSLEIYMLPEFRLVFHVPSFEQFQTMLFDSPVATNLGAQKSTDPVSDVLLTCMGPVGHRVPYLLATSSKGDFIVYRIYPLDLNSSQTEEEAEKFQRGPESRLAVRFHRVDHTFISREPLKSGPNVVTEQVSGNIPTPTETQDVIADSLLSTTPIQPRQRLLKPFSNVSGLQAQQSLTDQLTGVFVAGNRPAWVYVSSRQYLRIHPMIFDGTINHFAPFHNVNCKDGFVYFNDIGSLRLCQLDPHFNYDFTWPVQKKFINKHGSGSLRLRTADKITYHSISQKYCVLSCRDEQFFLPLEEETDENGENKETKGQAPSGTLSEVKTIETLPGEYTPMTKRYSLELFSSFTWGPVDRVEFLPNEQAICITECLLDVKVSGEIVRKSYIVIGTAFIKGEDVSTRGRVYIYEIIEVVPEPGRPETNHKVKLIKFEEFKGPVTAVCALNGHLSIAIGPKIMLYSFETGESLVGIAFLDTNLYITSMNSIKSFLLFCDIQKSVWFCGYQDEPSKIYHLGKDFQHCHAFDTNFMLDETSMGFVVVDRTGNIEVFSYNPTHVSSFSGLKLFRKGDFKAPSPIVRLRRFCKLSGEGNETMKQHGNFFACVNGSIGYVAPISEPEYRRLQDMSTEMMNRLDQPAGLNPRAFRLFQPNFHAIDSTPVRNILDADFVWNFANLATNDQVRWSRNKGTSRDRIINDLLLMEKSVDFF